MTSLCRCVQGIIQDAINIRSSIHPLSVCRYIIAGNHDYCGDVTKQLEYAKQESTLWEYPDYSYNIVKEFKAKDGSEVKKVEILMTDTQHIAGYFDCNRNDQDYPEGIKPNLQTKALSFIEDTLNNSSVDYLLVAGHYPVFSACSNGNTDELIQKLDPLLRKYGVTYQDMNIVSSTITTRTWIISLLESARIVAMALKRKRICPMVASLITSSQTIVITVEVVV